MNATEIEGEFPFEEIKKESGDYFDRVYEAKEAGYQRDQIWSVTEHDGVWCWGPPHHWVNLIGYVATKERHDFNTYYFETVPESYDEPTEADEWHSFDPDC